MRYLVDDIPTPIRQTGTSAPCVPGEAGASNDVLGLGLGASTAWSIQHGNETRRGTRLLDCYLRGWAEAEPLKIIQSTEHGYRFIDPFVGIFTRWSLPNYFDALHARLTATGPITHADLAFFLLGPIGQLSSRSAVQFWREAPRIGLTGVTKIKLGRHGVIAENVSYDLNLASDVLRRGS
jgi:hypothetical protein